MSTNIETDVLVVGGGGAGARAALEASRRGARVVMVMKGALGRSGATAYKVAETAGLNMADATVDAHDGPEQHFADIKEAGLGVCDDRLAWILANEALDVGPFLESIGVNFERDQDHYLTVTGCFASRPRMHILRGHGEPIIRALGQELRKTQVQICERVTITDLLVENGVCLGAVGLDDEGKWLVFSAGAVILATGGAGRLFSLTLSPPDITGDGYAMGLRGGAELFNLEFMQAGFGTLRPFHNLLHSWVWGLHPRMLNGYGQPFLSGYLSDGLKETDVMNAKTAHYPFSSRDVSSHLELSVKEEITAGRATPHGGIFLDFTQVDESVLPLTTPRGEEIQKVWPLTKEWYRSRTPGIDLDRELLEVGVFAHAINGGLRIDEHGVSTVRGLYAIGEAAAGPHGADRLGGNMLVGCQVFGRRAGIHAAQYSLSERGRSNRMSVTQAKEAMARVERLGRDCGGADLDSLREQLQQSMFDHMLVLRQRSGLNQCLSDIDRIRDSMKRRATTERVSSLVELVTLENLLIVAEMMTRAALSREESLGSHCRKDYPLRNDANWGKVTVFRLVDGNLRLTSEDLLGAQDSQGTR